MPRWGVGCIQEHAAGLLPERRHWGSDVEAQLEVIGMPRWGVGCNQEHASGPPRQTLHLRDAYMYSNTVRSV